MTTADIIRQRLYNQQITEHKFKTPAQIVSYMLAMQAQEYAMAKWAIGLRVPGLTDADVEKAFNDGRILRTHLMRPTWHFVTPKDIRWLLELTAPRVHAINAYMYRQCHLDTRILKKSTDIIAGALEGKKHLTRDELKLHLEALKIKGDGVMMSCILMYAELEQVICSGPRKGKQFTYALIDERVKATASMSHDEAIMEMAKRYFTSRGPATCNDFAVWSGLPLKEIRLTAADLPSYFIHETIDGNEYIFSSKSKSKSGPESSTFLMPDYDEYGMSYKDRTAIFDSRKYATAKRDGNPIFNRMMIIDGVIQGTWQRTIKNKTVAVETFPFAVLKTDAKSSLAIATEKFTSFVGQPKEND